MIIYTDGSAHPNPGPGGFGVVILDDNENLISTYGRQTDSITTNNREELKPIVSCLLGFGVKDPKRVNWPIVYTDSAYAYNTFTSWIFLIGSCNSTLSAIYSTLLPSKVYSM
jgi:ribonuclease HI